ncbi:MAG: pyruvate:ferredoxin (flavodoxin) oxidoreductase [Oscillospiraceae bacterium]|nr:pyruvate:ferredoxin (flavodoxin) oxidoreductase [Oscillospiraceae bacterium]
MNVKKRKMVAMDGNEAAAHIAYAFTEVAAIYPITPSSPMAEKTDEWSAKGRKNMFGQPVKLVEMQSEAGAIGAVHGALEAGSLATSFTSSQGLMLMIPVMYRIAGTKQPAVLHVASRTVGTHAMSIFGDHSDVMACRATGFAMFSTGSVQEVMDLAAVAHLAAVKTRVPFIHFFDGFRTSHEIHKIELMEQDEIAGLMDMEALKKYRDEALNPEHPTLRNTVQNPDVYFQTREANNRFYDAVPEVVEQYLNEINRLTGRNYGLFNYYGAPDARRVIIAMGSVSGTIMDTVDYLNAAGEKVGYLQVHLYRPFSLKHFLAALPETVEKIAVLDRCKEHGSVGEPLYTDVCSAFYALEKRPLIVGGRYGLSSKDTDAAQIKAVFDNLALKQPKNNFTIGILDDVTNLSLPLGEPLFTAPEGTVACKFWGLGSDGTVGANKNSIKIISEYTDMYTQAYFEYDTKKSFGITRSHLRFGKSPIRTTSLVKQADFVACHNQYFIGKYDIVSEVKPGGTFLLNTNWSDAELEHELPASVRRYIAENGVKFYTINANHISQELGLGNHANMVLQAAFFSIAHIIEPEKAIEYMKDAARKTFSKKGEDIVNKNLAAIDHGTDGLKRVNVPESWANASDEAAAAQEEELPPVIKNICNPINALRGDNLPVSAFIGYEDGTMPLGTTAYEKRGFATELPVWNKDACLQCNLCSYVCSHSVIRPYLMDAEETENAPAGFESVQAKGASAKEYKYTLQVSALDCTGCASCVSVCPSKGKALVMKPREETGFDNAHWAYALTLSEKDGVFNTHTVKGSQFKQPLVEFSGACAGCGETPYAKLLTQLFGDRVYWANATGCSQAWGAGMPSVAYTTNKCGRGPAWSNSLFEDNAEFSLGMSLAVGQQRRQIKLQLEELEAMLPAGNDALIAAIDDWEENFSSSANSRRCSDVLIEKLEKAALTGEAAERRDRLLERRDNFAKKSIWMFGGDGWAYDIGFGGLDHVFSMGEDVNVFIIDTEAYANTGGQASKATPMGAAAQFQTSGKSTAKKDIGRQLMTYGNVYVAQVAMGADPAQLIKALIEADNHPGPSIVIGYAPCVTHGIRLGMGCIQEEMKRAVASGYWHLYRYNPLDSQPFKLDSPEPTMDFKEFLNGEVRYSQLNLTFPENAQELFEKASREAKAKYENYKAMSMEKHS